MYALISIYQRHAFIIILFYQNYYIFHYPSLIFLQFACDYFRRELSGNSKSGAIFFSRWYYTDRQRNWSGSKHERSYRYLLRHLCYKYLLSRVE